MGRNYCAVTEIRVGYRAELPIGPDPEDAGKRCVFLPERPGENRKPLMKLDGRPAFYDERFGECYRGKLKDVEIRVTEKAGQSGTALVNFYTIALDQRKELEGVGQLNQDGINVTTLAPTLIDKQLAYAKKKLLAELAETGMRAPHIYGSVYNEIIARVVSDLP